jgi:hypothetical protein
VVKIIGLTGLVLVVGVLLYFLGKGNAVRAAARSKQTIGTGLPPGVH